MMEVKIKNKVMCEEGSELLIIDLNFLVSYLSLTAKKNVLFTFRLLIEKKLFNSCDNCVFDIFFLFSKFFIKSA